jgi:hypothetical protein
MVRRHSSSAVLAALGAVALLAGACAGKQRAPPEPQRRAFQIEGHGQLLLALPPGWTAAEGERGEASAPAIRLEKPGAAFVALLTPLWNPGGQEGSQASADTAQLLADMARRKALGGSVESEIPLEELVGQGVHGYWFVASDRELAGREPAPQEWRHVLQGAAAVGPIVLVFSLLDNGPGPQRADLLEIVRTARHAGEQPEEETEGQFVPVPGARTDPLRTAWPGKPWAVLVDLPGFRIAAPAGEVDGVILVGFEEETGIVVSVLLREAGGANDARGCREAALTRIASLAHVSEVRLADSGPAARAAYTVDALRGKPVRQDHAHAFLFREGVCGNVHVSKSEPQPEDAARIERILATVRFGDDL